MSSSRHHIPFPRNFLSLNTPVKKADNAGFVASPDSEVPQHTFLSNRPHPTPRHSSMSSVSSDESNISASPRPLPNDGDSSPVLKPALMSFLPLNTKHVAPPRQPGDGLKSPFLSNRG